MSDRYLVWDGARYDLADAPVPPPVPEPTPAPTDTPTWVRVGSAVHALDAVNPTSKTFPGGRGTGQLILYHAPVVSTGTNIHGREVRVGPDQKAMAATTAGNATVPARGFVLSGHDDPGGERAATWLAKNVPPGALVELGTGHVPTPAPPPAPVPAPAPTTGKTLAAYLMDGQGTVAGLPPEINQVRIAFVQGAPLRLVEWGGETPAQTGNGLQAWRTARVGPNAGAARTVLPSLGGQGGQVSLSDHAAFAAQFLGLLTKMPADGLPPGDGVDYDIEATPLAVLDAVTIEQTLAAQVPGWISSFVPSGGDPVPVYLRAAVQCHQLGLRVQYGQQFYDAAVSQQQVIGRVQEAINAGLPPSCILIGMMVGGDANHWTVDQCVANMQAIVAKWPDIGGAYVWESGRPGTSEWARRVGAVLGISA